MRKGIWIFIALVLAAGLAVDASAQRRKGRMMRAVSVSGDIQIIMPDGTVKGRRKGSRIGNIPPGARIKVLSGTAIFQIGNTIIKVEEGDQFTFTFKQGNVSITSLAGTVSVTSGGTTQILAKGKTATVPIATKIVKAPTPPPPSTDDTGGDADADADTGDSIPPPNPNAEEAIDVFVDCSGVSPSDPACS